MPENILVVEYEPRYTDRVRQALTGQPFHASFVKDGEEALRAIESTNPKLVVLSSVTPKISTPDLIRAIRGRNTDTQILITVSGYNGKTPKQDAVKFGASDLLPKPYTESEFLGKVQQMLGIPPEAQLTSNDIFGDVLQEEAASHATPRKNMSSKEDIDKLLADSLAGVMPKKKDPGAAGAKPRGDINKLVEDTLSGLEQKKKTTSTSTPVPIVPSAPPPPAAHPSPAPPPAPAAHAKVDRPVTDRIPVSQPVIRAVPPPAFDEPEPKDGKAFGQYVLLEKIATGGMAEVWKARKRGEEGFQKIVAIKKILPHLSDNQDFVEMFVDEAKLAAQLSHNNIIHIYDLGKIGTSYFIAMEYIEGHDLKTILRRAQERDHPLGPELALFIASKIASALDYAHRKRDFNEKEMELVHRDVSPQNVLVSEDGDIKLCDFGIAKAASKASHTQAGALKGKLQYMAPEQAWGRNIDRRSDVFALAAVLFELLTGRKLFTGENEMSILEQVREARVKPPSEINDEVTPEIDRIVLKALQKEPADRYQTAGEMAKDIDSVLYNFRPTPTSADLAIYMHRLWAPEPAMPQPVHHEEPPTAIRETPKPAPKPAAVTPVATPSTPPGVVMPAWDSPSGSGRAIGEKKRSTAVPLVVVGVLVAAIAGGFFYVRGRSTAAPQVTATATTAAAQPTSTTPAETGTLVDVATATSGTALPATTSVATVAATPTTATLDPRAVDAEVQRLVAAERARLEQQQREAAARVAAASPQPAPTRPIPAPAPVPVTQTVAAPEETATVATQTVAPPPPTETVAPVVRAREGDLIPTGTDGLTPPRVSRFATVAYPPMARAQKVEGIVLLNVLVSETGSVMEVRTIRGINRPVGLNEAAIQIIRKSTFVPGMKDGVRVKSWAVVPINFKL